MKKTIKVKEGTNYRVWGVYALIDRATNNILYIGSGDIADRKTYHAWAINNNKYKNTNKEILQNKDLILDVLWESTYTNKAKKIAIIKRKDRTEEQIKFLNDMQKELEIFENMYINMFKDTVCNSIKATKKYKRHSNNNTETYKRKLSNLGERNPNCTKLKEQDVIRILELYYKENKKVKDIAKMFNIAVNHAYHILEEKKWHYTVINWKMENLSEVQ